MSPEQPPGPGETHRRADSGLAFPVVGIGASAGGLSALATFFGQMPTHTGMAYVVVLHLSSRHESTADLILQRSTSMAVQHVVDKVQIEPDKVYVIPPSKQLLVEDGHLRLTDLERPSGGPLTIDLFFRSLAEAHRESAVAVVLSGSGSDGSQGLRRIKECGGITLVQSPADAEHDMMPLNAMATGVADFVMPAADMSQKLVELWQNAQHIELPDAPEDLRVAALRTAHAGVPPADPAGLLPTPAGSAGGDTRPAAGHADQRDQLLPRPRGLRCIRAHGVRPVERREPAAGPVASLGGRLRHRRRGLFGGHRADRAGAVDDAGACRAGVRLRHRRTRHLGGPQRAVRRVHRHRRVAGTPAPVLPPRSRPVPHRQGGARTHHLLGPQPAARSAVFPHARGVLPQPADLPGP